GDDELELRLARPRDLAVARWSQHDDPGTRELAAEVEAFRDGCDAERGRALTECGPRHVGGAVAVAVRLDHGPELGAGEGAAKRARVAAKSAEVDLDLRAGHGPNGREGVR